MHSGVDSYPRFRLTPHRQVWFDVRVKPVNNENSLPLLAVSSSILASHVGSGSEYSYEIR